MNNVYGAVGLTAILLIFLTVYILRNRPKRSYHPAVSQAMLHHRFWNSKQHSRKLKTKTQARIHQEKNNVKVIIIDNQAYWIKDNIFYMAPMINEIIDKDSAQRVDTTNMDRVQLDKMLFIVDKLTEGVNDDSRGSGNA